MTLTSVLVYHEDTMFARSIKDYVIIFNNNFVQNKFQFKADLCRLEICLAGIH